MLSCGIKVKCPKFDKDILNWVPYQNNDTIKLVNLKNDSVLLLIIDTLMINHTTYFLTSSDCGGCGDDILVNNYETKDLQIMIFISDNTITGQCYTIKGTYFEDDSIDYLDYIEQPDYLFNGICYDNVHIFENKKTGEKFKKLIVAKEFGIVGLIDKDDNIWFIEGNTVKNINYLSYKIQESSCAD